MTKCLLVDYGGVLADDNVALYADKLSVELHSPIAMIRSAISERTTLGRALRLDLISERDFWTAVHTELHPNEVFETDPSLLTKLWAGCYSIRPDVANILIKCQQQGLQIGVATNVDRYREQYLIEQLGRHNLEVIVWSSYELGYVKPEYGYYREVTSKLGSCTSTNSILYIDDRQSHVDAATKFGWCAVRANNATSIQSWLVEMNLN